MNYCIPSLRTPGPRIEWKPRPATCECGERFTQHAPNQTRCPKCAEVRAALMLRRRRSGQPVEEPHYEASYDDLPEALGPQGEE